MKKVLTILIVCSTLLTTGCKKDTTSANLSSGKSQISASVSGTVSSSFSSSILVSTVAKSTDLINVSGGTASVPIQQFMFILPANIAVGTYTFSTLPSNSIINVTYTNGGTGWAAGEGDNFTLRVTTATATDLEATFSGTLKNDTDKTTVTVTNGKLAAKY